MSDATTVVDRFVAAWPRKDVDELLSFFSHDAVYENVPIDPPSRGVGEIRKTIEQFSGMATQIEFVVHHQTTAGSVVMNERTDRFEIDGKWVEIRVMGCVPAREPKDRGLARLLRPRPVHAADARPGRLTESE